MAMVTSGVIVFVYLKTRHSARFFKPFRLKTPANRVLSNSGTLSEFLTPPANRIAS
jgi:hypothetical protein